MNLVIRRQGFCVVECSERESSLHRIVRRWLSTRLRGCIGTLGFQATESREPNAMSRTNKGELENSCRGLSELLIAAGAIVLSWIISWERAWTGVARFIARGVCLATPPYQLPLFTAQFAFALRVALSCRSMQLRGSSTQKLQINKTLQKRKLSEFCKRSFQKILQKIKLSQNSIRNAFEKFCREKLLQKFCKKDFAKFCKKALTFCKESFH